MTGKTLKLLKYLQLVVYFVLGNSVIMLFARSLAKMSDVATGIMLMLLPWAIWNGLLLIYLIIRIVGGLDLDKERGARERIIGRLVNWRCKRLYMGKMTVVFVLKRIFVATIFLLMSVGIAVIPLSVPITEQIRMLGSALVVLSWIMCYGHAILGCVCVVECVIELFGYYCPIVGPIFKSDSTEE